MRSSGCLSWEVTLISEKLGLVESVSMALGGMIGGGIFAVLGVIAQITHAITWFAFIVAGIIAFAAGYSYNVLNRLSNEPGGSVTFVQSFTGNSTMAGMTGWTLLFGYIGSMAMYAYAFGSFFTGLVGLERLPGLGLSLRPVISVLSVGLFAGLNILGARSTGLAEDILVGLKIGILLLFGLWGLIYGLNQGSLEFGISRLRGFNPVIAAAVSFVAFQGWQLIFYDQESVKDPVNTIRKAVNIAIPASVLIYVIVAITTLSLAPLSVVTHHPERALAVAARPFMEQTGFTLISLAALFSTGSAVNATLFSSSYFAKRMLSRDLLPDRVGDSSQSGLPVRALLVIAVITAAFTWFGSLGAVTSFASISFIIVFGSMCYLAFKNRGRSQVNFVLPLIGIIGSAGFLPLMFWHLYRSEPEIFYTVLLLAGAIFVVEALYFEREFVIEELEEVGEEVIEVLKKEGHREAFDRGKIVESCRQTGAPEESAEEVAKNVEAKAVGMVRTTELRNLVLEELGSVNEDWVENWKKYEKREN
jgi:amino acid transporter